MKVIDGDKFQKDYKKQVEKDKTSKILIAILMIIIGIIGIFSKDDILYKIISIVAPVLIAIVVIKKILLLKDNFKRKDSFFSTIEIIKIVFLVLFGLFIFLNPKFLPKFIINLLCLYIIFNSIIQYFVYKEKYLLIRILIAIIILILSNFILKFINIFFVIALLFFGINLLIDTIKKA